MGFETVEGLVPPVDHSRVEPLRDVLVGQMLGAIDRGGQDLAI